MTINQAGLDLIKSFEGCKLQAYPDPGTGGRPWTIGWGHTLDVKPYSEITQEEADALLASDLDLLTQCVKNFVSPVSLTDNQLAALVSFAYNVGAWRSTTLFNLVRNNKLSDAAEQFQYWDHSGGRVLEGLTRRRAAEKALFLS